MLKSIPFHCLEGATFSFSVAHYSSSSFLLLLCHAIFKCLLFYKILFFTTLKDLEAAQITPSVFDSEFPPMGHDF